MAPIIAVANHKGGAGKTTTAYYIAQHLAERMNVLAVDLDDQAGLTSRLLVDPKPRLTVADVLLREAQLEQATVFVRDGLYLLPADTKLSWAAAKIQAMSPNHLFLARALQQASEYDVIILDCPPSADIVIVNAMMAATHLVLAATPTVESWEGTVRMRGMVDDLLDVTGKAPKLVGIVATQIVGNSNPHREHIEMMKPWLIGCIPQRTGMDAPAQLLAAYGPVAAEIMAEVEHAA